MNYNQITIGLVTFKSEKVIFNCLKSIKSIKNIIIFDNSNDNKLKIKIKKKYPNIKFYLSKKNVGYGAGNNIIIKKSKTPYVFILSPDVVLNNNCEKNLLVGIKKLKNNFSILSPISNDKNYRDINNSSHSKSLFEVDYVKGFAMLLNKKKIIQNGMFDENIFLYLEEIDLCRRLRNAKQKIFITKKSKVFHLGARSSNLGLEFDKLRNWHWMWSKFYYNKKYKGFFIATILGLPKFITSLLKFLFYLLIQNRQKKIIYYFRVLGFCNALFGKKSHYRPIIKTN